MRTIFCLVSLAVLTACGTPISERCRQSAGVAPAGSLRSEPVTVTGPLVCAPRAADAGHVVCRLASGTGAEVWVGVEGKGPEEYPAGTNYAGRLVFVGVRASGVSVSAQSTSMTVREIPNQTPRAFELSGIGCDGDKGVSANGLRITVTP